MELGVDLGLCFLLLWLCGKCVERGRRAKERRRRGPGRLRRRMERRAGRDVFFRFRVEVILHEREDCKTTFGGSACLGRCSSKSGLEMSLVLRNEARRRTWAKWFLLCRTCRSGWRLEFGHVFSISHLQTVNDGSIEKNEDPKFGG
jgi:hypothetical protein